MSNDHKETKNNVKNYLVITLVFSLVLSLIVGSFSIYQINLLKNEIAFLEETQLLTASGSTIQKETTPISKVTSDDSESYKVISLSSSNTTDTKSEEIWRRIAELSKDQAEMAKKVEDLRSSVGRLSQLSIDQSKNSKDIESLQSSLNNALSIASGKVSYSELTKFKEEINSDLNAYRATLYSNLRTSLYSSLYNALKRGQNNTSTIVNGVPYFTEERNNDMSADLIQLYSNSAKTKKAYPITTADAVLDENGNPAITTLKQDIVKLEDEVFIEKTFGTVTDETTVTFPLVDAGICFIHSAISGVTGNVKLYMLCNKNRNVTPHHAYLIRHTSGNNYVIDDIMDISSYADFLPSADRSVWLEIETFDITNASNEYYIGLDYLGYTNLSTFYNEDGWVNSRIKAVNAVIGSTFSQNVVYSNGLLMYYKIDGSKIPTKVSQLQNDSGYVKASEISIKPFANCIGYFDGDSITDQERYNQPLSNALGLASFVKYGVSGTCIARTSVRGTSAVQYTDPICLRYERYGTDADIITILGGTNDYGLSVPLGTFDPNAETDNIETFYGALNHLCKGLVTKYPDKRIFLFTPIQRFYNGSGQPQGIDENSAGHTLKDYCDAIKEVGARYGIPVFDLYSESGFNIVTIDNWTSDGLHPNAVGGKVLGKVMADYINQYSPFNVN